MLETSDMLPSTGEDVTLLVPRVALVSDSVVPALRTKIHKRLVCTLEEMSPWGSLLM